MRAAAAAQTAMPPERCPLGGAPGVHGTGRRRHRERPRSAYQPGVRDAAVSRITGVRVACRKDTVRKLVNDNTGYRSLGLSASPASTSSSSTSPRTTELRADRIEFDPAALRTLSGEETRDGNA